MLKFKVYLLFLQTKDNVKEDIQKKLFLNCSFFLVEKAKKSVLFVLIDKFSFQKTKFIKFIKL